MKHYPTAAEVRADKLYTWMRQHEGTAWHRDTLTKAVEGQSWACNRTTLLDALKYLVRQGFVITRRAQQKRGRGRPLVFYLLSLDDSNPLVQYRLGTSIFWPEDLGVA